MIFSEMSNLWRIILLLFLLIPVVGDMCVLPSVFFRKNNETRKIFLLAALALNTGFIKIDADKDAEYVIAYESSNASIVTVDKDGNVTATGTGEAEITVTVTDEYGNVVEDTCKVTVSYAWWQWIIIIVLFGWIWH